MKMVHVALILTSMHCVPVAGATLFQDNFSNAVTSRAQWIDRDNLKPVFLGGSMYVGSVMPYPAIVAHAVNCSTFTYTVRIRTLKSGTYPMPGIVFCGGVRTKTGGGQYYGGYAFSVAKGQTYSISKMLSNGTVPTVYSAYNSYVNDGENVLTVSKAGTHLIFSCNGAFLTGLVDSTFSKGEIGIMVYTGDSIAVDDVILTDDFRPGVEVKNFRDPFGNPALIGWNLWVNGWQNKANASVSDGVLTFAPSVSTGLTAIYTDGAFKDAPVRVAVRFLSGDTTGFYGVMLMRYTRTFGGGSVGIAPAGQSGFVISGKGSWGFFSNGSWIPQKSAAIHGNGFWDTLGIRVNASKELDFYVNNTFLATYNETKYDYNAAGLYIDNGLTVQFDDFAVGDSAVNVGVRNGERRLRPALSIADPARMKGTTWYDLSGRNVIRAGAAGCFMVKQAHAVKYVLIK